MSRLNRKYFSLIIICILTATYSYSQIKVSEFIQESKIASADNNKLFFVDFWATWCAPCITAKEQLGVLQAQFPNDFYVVSLTEQSPLVVERFLDKKPTDLAIAIDYNRETFKKYNVKILPAGVLFNAKGEIVWKGSAPNLKKEMVSRFLRQQTARASVDSFFKVIATPEEYIADYIPSKSIEIKRLNSTLNDEVVDVVDNTHYLKLRGSLRSIVGYLAKIYKDQIVLEDNLNEAYEVYFKKPYNASNNLAYAFISKLDLEVERKYDNGMGLIFTINTPKFWDTNQINWGNANAKYLVGDSQIQADNVSLKDIAYQLAYVKDMPVVISKDSDINYTLHDWDFHYKFFQLMQTDLEDNYGIKVEKKNVSFPVYHIQKKAP